MREIILDTETTGIKPAEGHRIVEIGAIELVNHLPTGKTYHVHINPERDMPPEAEAVHGLTAAFLSAKPVFAKIADEFLAFIADATLVIHNASFDLSFLNAELGYLNYPPILPGRVVDTLMLARAKHPMAPNSLDALCKRYAIDNSRRTKHGALLDSELLAEVYIELIGGRQTALSLASSNGKLRDLTHTTTPLAARPRPLAARLTEAELQAHAALIQQLGPDAMWKTLA